MESLRRRQRRLRRHLSTLETWIASGEGGTGVINQAKEVWSDFQTLQDEMMAAAEDEVEEEEICNEFEEDHNRVLALQTRRGMASDGGSSDRSSVDVRLPSLDLPTFDGDLTGWCAFSDLFGAAVNKNGAITNAQKLQYLKGALKGEPASLVKHFSVANSSYEDAWDLLRERYEDKRRIANQLVCRIISLMEGRKSLRSILDIYNEAERALKSLIPEEEKWDLIIQNIIAKNLDTETLQAWELSLKTKEVPPLEDFLEFLEIRARVVGSSQNNGQRVKMGQRCPECKEQHPLMTCPVYGRADVDKRRQLVVKHKLCYNCLSPNHTVYECKAGRCKNCQGKHHVSLHVEGRKNLAVWKDTGKTLLPTVLLSIRGRNGHQKEVRALLDTGSEFNIISGRAVEAFGLEKRKAGTSARTIGGDCLLPCTVDVDIHTARLKGKLKCYVAENLSFQVPTGNGIRKQWCHTRRLRLAGPEFYKPKDLDIILGAAVTGRIIQGGIRKGGPEEPIAQKTTLEWVISGKTDTQEKGTFSAFCNTSDVLRRFWELEEVPTTAVLTPEERAAESHFAETTKRLADGSYEVSYPFHEEPPLLGESKNQAVKRFLRLESKLQERDQWEEYAEAMDDYMERTHIVPVQREDLMRPSNYLPHHAVYKDSVTTKVRIVFDASAKTTNGKSLNDTMYNGPRTQDELFHILIRFQTHAVAITADIEKMYRQVHLASSQQNFQRIIWRRDKREPLREYKLTRLTFGVKSAPYLATKVLSRLAEDEAERHPIGRDILKRDFYVDDLLTGADSRDAAKELAMELDNVLTAGGFKLRKWRSSDISAVDGIAEDKDVVAIPNEDSIKTLGLLWNPQEDCFTFKICIPPRTKHTRRSLLSDAARIFDPLGWLAPITVRAKMMFQSLWTTCEGWDDELREPLVQDWKTYREELKAAEDIKIPRYTPLSIGTVTLCGFCDASEKGYGAVVYLRSEQEKISTKLLVSKSKVAPMKPVSIPRLELCAAVLLSRLITETKRALRQNCKTLLWTDSAVVLHWIAQHPSKWKAFVAHRVIEIQENTPPSEWHHVSTRDNPADLISRGVSAQTLKESTIWWKGPPWLRDKELPTFTLPEISVIPEVKREKLLGLNIIQEEHFVERFSSMGKLLRVVALMKRFVDKSRKRSINHRSIRVNELRQALSILIKQAQALEFKEEIADLSRGKPIKKRSKLLALSPFLDEQGLLRVGGRLDNSSLQYDQKHQIIIPRKHKLTTLLIRDLHVSNLHAGVQLLLNTLRQRYWLPRARTAIREVVHNCTTCRRYKAEVGDHLMGQLPGYRLKLDRPFLHTGVDYCGPILCKEVIGRTRKPHKTFVAIFVCMATKAVHLEAVSSLTMESFLAAFGRFTSRRGLPTDVYSDNGRNFVGANRYLRDVYDGNYEQLEGVVAKEGIQWHFNPPYSPHLGGLWEAAVKSLKFHLKRIVGQQVLTFEEFSTVLCKIEACLNSRPLCPLSEDPEDREALTPGHFLIGHSLNAVPDPRDLSSLSIRSRFQLQGKLVRDVWNRWKTEYLTTLQGKTKWRYRGEPLKTGDLVIIKDDNAPPQHWHLGRKVSTSADKDNQSRVVTVKTASGITSRARTKIIKLF